MKENSDSYIMLGNITSKSKNTKSMNKTISIIGIPPIVIVLFIIIVLLSLALFYVFSTRTEIQLIFLIFT